MKALNNSCGYQDNKQQKRVAYETPAVIFETLITTRAGSPLSIDDAGSKGVDPADLFGN